MVASDVVRGHGVHIPPPPEPNKFILDKKHFSGNKTDFEVFLATKNKEKLVAQLPGTASKHNCRQILRDEGNAKHSFQVVIVYHISICGNELKKWTSEHFPISRLRLNCRGIGTRQSRRHLNKESDGCKLGWPIRINKLDK